jgi:hypothetical protein
LRKVYGTDLELSRRAPETLKATQLEFCHSLHDPRPSERFGLAVIALGHAMRNSEWLREHWNDGYVAELDQIGSLQVVEAAFRVFETAKGDDRESLIDYLGSKVGTCSRDSPFSSQREYSVFLPSEPIWFEAMDIERDKLRRYLRAAPNIPPALALACVQQSCREHDTVVQSLVGILHASADMNCVSLAGFLGPRTLEERTKVQDCWRKLLLHMMRQQPPNLLERCAKNMPLSQWRNWLVNMRRLFGDRHLDPHGGLGCTAEKISALTNAKMAFGWSPS